MEEMIKNYLTMYLDLCYTNIYSLRLGNYYTVVKATQVLNNCKDLLYFSVQYMEDEEEFEQILNQNSKLEVLSINACPLFKVLQKYANKNEQLMNLKVLELTQGLDLTQIQLLATTCPNLHTIRANITHDIGAHIKDVMPHCKTVGFKNSY